jgi:quercetin 2,3-dioxygenase
MIGEVKKTIEHLFVYAAEARATERRPGFLSRQSFNFGAHHVKGREGFGSLRVFNDDRVEHGVGIPQHPHANFEILSVILAGEMAHEDNLGNSIVVRTNDVKLMSAGSGLFHGGTCYNNTNFLQIWMEPNQINTPPVVKTMSFQPDSRVNRWQLQVSPNVNDGVLTIKQSIRAFRGVFDIGQANFKLSGKYRIFLMPLSGAINLNHQSVKSRDSAEFIVEEEFSFSVNEASDLWLMAEEI